MALVGRFELAVIVIVIIENGAVTGLVRKKDMKKRLRLLEQVQAEQSVRLSRTQKKRAALSLQDLGERLVRLSDEQLKQVGLPEDVLTAVKAAKTIKKHGPLSRQMQYIGALMRRYDPAPIREFLGALDQGNRQQAERSRKLCSPKCKLSAPHS